MNGELFTVLNFLDGNKWFIMAVTTYNNEDYKYLVKVNEDETDFEEEFLLVKYYVKNGEEYIEQVLDNTVRENVMLQIFPEIKPLLDNKESLLQKMQA